jgi:membrane-associated PAP2 superfamily phosphatase
MTSMLDYYRSQAGRVFLRRNAMGLLLYALLLLAVFESSDLDREISRRFFDVERQEFVLAHRGLVEAVFHRGARALSLLAALVVASLCVVSWRAPGSRWARYRVELTFMSVALFAAPLVVGLLKHVSTHACPWNIVEFGGKEAYRHLLTPRPAQFNEAGCIPAAHPVSGFAWFALAIVLRARDARRAWLFWGAALLVGLTLGVVQILRGAHFLSHALWSVAVVWGLNLALAALMARLPIAKPRIALR